MSKRNLGILLSAGAAVLALAAALVAELDLAPGHGIDRTLTSVMREAVRGEPAALAQTGPAESASSALDSSDTPIARGNVEADADASTPDDATASADQGGDHLHDGMPLTADHPFVAPVIAIQERWTRTLLDHPLVVGTAVGMNEAGEIAVAVLAKAEIHDLPDRLEGVPVIVVVTGELFASRGRPPGSGGGKDKDGDSAPAVDPTARFTRPVPIGVSTGHPDITAGTIGCRVVKSGGTLCALSNNHVYADENSAEVGDAVIQPGTYDSGLSPVDDIGQLDDYVPLVFATVQSGGVNTMDAAIATTGVDLGNSTPSDGYGTPRSTTVSPAINLRVRKYGRTTGETTGRIQAINASVNVGYSNGTAGFVGQFVVSGGSFSAGGDSGSLIVAQKGSNARKPVGLLFAGGSSATIASPIDPILAEFDVTVDGD